MSAATGPVAALRRVCRAALLATPGVPAVVAWEARAVDAPAPSAGVCWLAEALQPGAEVLAGTGWLERRAVFALTLYAPVGHPTVSATGALDTLAGALADAFAPGRTLSAPADPVRAWVDAVSDTPAAAGPDWLVRGLRVGVTSRRRRPA